MSVWFSCLVLLAASASAADARSVVEESVVDTVWPGHTVGFSLLTHPPYQFAAYYDAERHMTVARRDLAGNDWRRVHLPEELLWDSHNYVTMAIDKDGCLHISGNMHVKPLVYFRSEKPLDIDSLVRLPMTGEREDRCTYPSFLKGPQQSLVFTYRDGRSGSGDQIYNRYDEASRTWRRLLDTPLTTGNGKMNAYFQGPVLGPDDRYHLCWVWRDNPGCESNHDLCYARSADLVHWETGAGKPLALPISVASADIVDPVPPKGGIINGCTKLGFDSLKRPIISYHKFDADGNTQIYNARCEDGVWKTYQATHWDYRWEFSGGGSIRNEIGLSGVSIAGKGTLKQTYTHVKIGAGGLLLDEATLAPLGPYKEPAGEPKEMSVVRSAFPGMQIRRAADLGESGQPGVMYVMQWETLGANRDKPREGPLPEPASLRVLKIR